ncbi:MAG TPA: hypothetical protein VJ692_15910 [Nitrospiraceae bacterium]|nr:hypothetical protein [Nitrospiraceae bacterium]
MTACGRETPATLSKVAADSAQRGPVWAVDPKDPGTNLPPVGRSLFDYLVTESNSDKLVYKVPVPFTALVEKIERQLDAEPSRSPLKRVLIPLNRSLQRHAARPDFFKYPRAVLGVDTEPPLHAGSSGLLLKDRMFVGYQEKANIIEVISYNEAAGRFEFQVVRDYRPGGTPTVLYANRAVCTACHQNHSAIFARPLWDETNANPKIATLIQAERRDLYRFPIHQGIDIPNALDEATDRANEMSVSQLLWQQGCERGESRPSIECRADLLRFVLQYRLSGARGFETGSSRFVDDFAPRFLKGWKEKWPQGLLIPNPDIPNRNPFEFFRTTTPGAGYMQTVASEGGSERFTHRSLFEPTVPRSPLATWSVTEGNERVQHVIEGLAGFLAEPDIRRLDAHLFQQASTSGGPARQYEAQCVFNPRGRRGSIERLIFHCVPPDRAGGSGRSFAMDGAIYVSGGKIQSGAIDHLSFSDSGDIGDLDIVRGGISGNRASVKGRLEPAQRHSRLHARRVDGNAVNEISFQMSGPSFGHESSGYSGSAVLTMLDDFSAVEQAIDVMARETLANGSDVFSDRPFRRAAIMEALYAHLHMPRLTWCCADDDGMPDAIADVAAGPPDFAVPTAGAQETVPELRPFHHYCAKCHRGEDTFPPNFLHGSPDEVRAKIRHCAPRIFFRLEMWRVRSSDRPETPMPPVTALRRLDVTPEQWAGHPDLAMLTQYAAGLLKDAGDQPPHPGDFITQEYDSLRECLPAQEPPDFIMPDAMPTSAAATMAGRNGSAYGR